MPTASKVKSKAARIRKGSAAICVLDCAFLRPTVVEKSMVRFCMARHDGTSEEPSFRLLHSHDDERKVYRQSGLRKRSDAYTVHTLPTLSASDSVAQKAVLALHTDFFLITERSAYSIVKCLLQVDAQKDARLRRAHVRCKVPADTMAAGRCDSR